MNKLAVVVAAGIVLGSAAGVYWFRSNRLTPADLAGISTSQEGNAASAQPTPATSDPNTNDVIGTDDPAKGSKERQQERARAMLAKARMNADRPLDPNDAARMVKDLPPAVTIIPHESMPEKTPDKFTVLFDTTKGQFAVEFVREWAPHGVDRMYELVRDKFFTDMRVFRVVKGFVAQFGIPGDPAISKKWLDKNIPDDPVKQSNTKGMLTFAAAGTPNTRSAQVFINLGDNAAHLDALGFAPIGKVIFGMGVVESLYSGYGESVTNLQGQIAEQGNAFLDAKFPELDSIKRASFIEDIKDADAIFRLQREMGMKALEDIAHGRTNRGVSETAPDKFRVTFECTMGTFVVECYREWSPLGADRFYTLVKNGFYDDARFFRVVPGFIVQFGLPAISDIRGTWIKSTFPDDPFKVSNTKGTIAFAKPARPSNARTTQVFINLADNGGTLDPQSFTPFGKIVEGMDVVERINSEYREQPDQDRIRTDGNKYLDDEFPRLDGIKVAKIEGEPQTTTPVASETTAQAPATQ